MVNLTAKVNKIKVAGLDTSAKCLFNTFFVLGGLKGRKNVIIKGFVFIFICT